MRHKHTAKHIQFCDFSLDLKCTHFSTPQRVIQLIFSFYLLPFFRARLVQAGCLRLGFVPEGIGQHLGAVAAVLVLAGNVHHFVQQPLCHGDGLQAQVAELLVGHLRTKLCCKCVIEQIKNNMMHVLGIVHTVKWILQNKGE